MVTCELCELAEATLKCSSCESSGVGEAFCEPCSKNLHSTVKGKSHALTDMDGKPLPPSATLAPPTLLPPRSMSTITPSTAGSSGLLRSPLLGASPSPSPRAPAIPRLSLAMFPRTPQPLASPNGAASTASFSLLKPTGAAGIKLPMNLLPAAPLLKQPPSPAAPPTPTGSGPASSAGSKQMCGICEADEATQQCDACHDVYCDDCDGDVHTSASKMAHVRKPMGNATKANTSPPKVAAPAAPTTPTSLTMAHRPSISPLLAAPRPSVNLLSSPLTLPPKGAIPDTISEDLESSPPPPASPSPPTPTTSSNPTTNATTTSSSTSLRTLRRPSAISITPADDAGDVVQINSAIQPLSALTPLPPATPKPTATPVKQPATPTAALPSILPLQPATPTAAPVKPVPPPVLAISPQPSPKIEVTKVNGSGASPLPSPKPSPLPSPAAVKPTTPNISTPTPAVAVASAPTPGTYPLPTIPTCGLCDDVPSTVHCNQCSEDYCDECSTDFHKPAKQQGHTLLKIVTRTATPATPTQTVSAPTTAANPAAPLSPPPVKAPAVPATAATAVHSVDSIPTCSLCDDQPSAVHCNNCDEDYCAECSTDFHKPAKQQGHVILKIAAKSGASETSNQTPKPPTVVTAPIKPITLTPPPVIKEPIKPKESPAPPSIAKSPATTSIKPQEAAPVKAPPAAAVVAKPPPVAVKPPAVIAAPVKPPVAVEPTPPAVVAAPTVTTLPVAAASNQREDSSFSISGSSELNFEDGFFDVFDLEDSEGRSKRASMSLTRRRTMTNKTPPLSTTNAAAATATVVDASTSLSSPAHVAAVPSAVPHPIAATASASVHPPQPQPMSAAPPTTVHVANPLLVPATVEKPLAASSIHVELTPISTPVKPSTPPPSTPPSPPTNHTIAITTPNGTSVNPLNNVFLTPPHHTGLAAAPQTIIIPGVNLEQIAREKELETPARVEERTCVGDGELLPTKQPDSPRRKSVDTSSSLVTSSFESESDRSLRKRDRDRDHNRERDSRSHRSPKPPPSPKRHSSNQHHRHRDKKHRSKSKGDRQSSASHSRTGSRDTRHSHQSSISSQDVDREPRHQSSHRRHHRSPTDMRRHSRSPRPHSNGTGKKKMTKHDIKPASTTSSSVSRPESSEKRRYRDYEEVEDDANHDDGFGPITYSTESYQEYEKERERFARQNRDFDRSRSPGRTRDEDERGSSYQPSAASFNRTRRNYRRRSRSLDGLIDDDEITTMNKKNGNSNNPDLMSQLMKALQTHGRNEANPSTALLHIAHLATAAAIEHAHGSTSPALVDGEGDPQLSPRLLKHRPSRLATPPEIHSVRENDLIVPIDSARSNHSSQSTQSRHSTSSGGSTSKRVRDQRFRESAAGWETRISASSSLPDSHYPLVHSQSEDNEWLRRKLHERTLNGRNGNHHMTNGYSNQNQTPPLSPQPPSAYQQQQQSMYGGPFRPSSSPTISTLPPSSPAMFHSPSPTTVLSPSTPNHHTGFIMPSERARAASSPFTPPPHPNTHHHHGFGSPSHPPILPPSFAHYPHSPQQVLHPHHSSSSPAPTSSHHSIHAFAVAAATAAYHHVARQYHSSTPPSHARATTAASPPIPSNHPILGGLVPSSPQSPPSYQPVPPPVPPPVVHSLLPPNPYLMSLYARGGSS